MKQLPLKASRKWVALLLVLLMLAELFLPGMVLPRGTQEQAQAATIRETIRLPNATYPHINAAYPGGLFLCPGRQISMILWATTWVKTTSTSPNH